MDVVEISLVWALGCAAVAAAANTLVAGKFRFLPSIEVRSPGTSPLLVFGLVGNVAIAAAAAFLAWMTVGGYGRGPLDETGTVLSSLAYVGIGFVGSRWATTEYDKVVLRRAVCKAAMAPAANPEIVQTLRHASPEQVYDIVDALMPRRAVHRV